MNKVTRILIGYWNNKDNMYPEYPMPVPEGIMDVQMYKFHDMLADYLDSGMITNRQRGSSTCRFTGKSNGSFERCDDKYIWPSGLSHYIRNYHIVLPQDFYEHIMKNRFKIPEFSIEKSSIFIVDKTDWINWAVTGEAPLPHIEKEKELIDALNNEIRLEFDKMVLDNIMANFS